MDLQTILRQRREQLGISEEAYQEVLSSYTKTPEEVLANEPGLLDQISTGALDVARGVIRTPVRLAQNVAAAGRILGGQSFEEATAPRYSRLLGEEITPVGTQGGGGLSWQNLGGAIGAGLELSSFIPVSRGVQAGARGLITAAAREGAVGGSLASAGQQLSETGTINPLNVARDAAIGAGLGGVLGGTVAGVQGVSRATERASRSLGELLNQTRANLGDNILEGTLRTVDAVRQVPETIGNAARRAVDRRIVRVASTTPEKAQQEIVNLYKKGIVPGVKGKKKTLDNISNIENSVKESVPRMAKLTDETGEFLYNVENIQDFANTIGSEERRIWNQISEGLTKAGESGKLIDTKPIVDELVQLMNSERASLSSQLKRTIQSKINELAEVAEDGSIVASKQITPQGAQDFLSDLNAQLQSYYRGSTSGTNADVIVDTLVSNNLRKQLDEVVNSLDETTFRELKRQYGQLKDMEKDVVHRAVFEAQKGQGLSKITDIMSAGDLTAGLLDPAFLARGVGQYLTKEVIQSLTNKDELIRQMWLYAKNLPSDVRVPGTFNTAETALVSQVDNSLIDEARKYKSAEEFVKAQEDKLYIHGTQKKIEGKLELKSKASGVQTPEKDAVDVLYVTPNTETGKMHSRMYTKQNGVTYAIKLKPEAKIFDYTNPSHRKMIEKTMTESQKKLVNDNLVDGQLSWMATPPVKNVKKLGFDGMKQIERKAGEDAYSATFGDAKYSENAESLMLFNKNVFEQVDTAQTKPQLTDIWNRANK